MITRPASIVGSRCRECRQEIIWARLDEESANAGKWMAVDLLPVEQGGTIEIYWGSGRGQRYARVHPRGSSLELLRRPHFATCRARILGTAG